MCLCIIGGFDKNEKVLLLAYDNNPLFEVTVNSSHQYFANITIDKCLVDNDFPNDSKMEYYFKPDNFDEFKVNETYRFHYKARLLKQMEGNTIIVRPRLLKHNYGTLSNEMEIVEWDNDNSNISQMRNEILQKEKEILEREHLIDNSNDNEMFCVKINGVNILKGYPFNRGDKTTTLVIRNILVAKLNFETNTYYKRYFDIFNDEKNEIDVLNTNNLNKFNINDKISFTNKYIVKAGMFLVCLII